MKRPVAMVLDECFQCRDAETRRWYRGKKGNPGWSEYTHSKHRAPIEAADSLAAWERIHGSDW